jgi:hypothetical protein
MITRLPASLLAISALSAATLGCGNPLGSHSFKELAYTAGAPTITPAATVSVVTVAAVTPATGVKIGGTAITITGTGFATGAVVLLGTDTCVNIVFVSANSIRCSTPAVPTAKTTGITVTNTDGGTGTLSSAFAYTTSAPLPSGVSGRAIASAGGAAFGAGMQSQTTAGEIGSPAIQVGTGMRSQTGLNSINF